MLPLAACSIGCAARAASGNGRGRPRGSKMVRFATCVTIAAMPASAGLAFAGAEPAAASEGADALIIQAKNHAELTEKFCAANPNVEHIVVVPASLFVD